MKNILTTTLTAVLPAVCTLFLISACGSPGMSSDAAGTFEAEEITVSAEASGRIEWLSVEEGQSLRAGETVCTVDRANASAGELASLMMGRELAPSHYEKITAPGEPVVSLEKVD